MWITRGHTDIKSEGFRLSIEARQLPPEINGILHRAREDAFIYGTGPLDREVSHRPPSAGKTRSKPVTGAGGGHTKNFGFSLLRERLTGP